MRTKYINPFTNYGFKKLFGEEASKKLLMSFLNDLLPIRDKIINLKFKKNEQQGEIVISRKAVYDIFCEDEKGSQFIVEMQNAKQLYFLKNLESFNKIPDILKEDIFEEAFKVAEIGKFTPEELMEYEESLRIYRDNINVIETAKEEGREEGELKKSIEIATNLLDVLDDNTIAIKTGLSVEEVKRLR